MPSNPCHSTCFVMLIALSVFGVHCGSDRAAPSEGDAAKGDAGDTDARAARFEDASHHDARRDARAPVTVDAADAPLSWRDAASKRDGFATDADGTPGADATATDAPDDAPNPRTDATATDASDDAPNVRMDAGCAVFELPEDCESPTGSELPRDLRCTGLYGDWATRRLACGIVEFSPEYELWSDGASKRRFLSLPPDTAADDSDPDEFLFPVGTQLWKEFRLPTDGGFVLGETRLLRKVQAGWLYTTYVWSSDETEAVQENGGVADLHGTGHPVPTRDQCEECHGGRPDFVLGWDPVLRGETAIPGDAIERAALGYLHVNCGVSCHNRTSGARANTSGLLLRLDDGTLDSVSSTDAVVTGINRTPSPNAPLGDLEEPAGGPFYDLLPLDPSRSLLLARMKLRNHPAQMPRIGTNRVDDEGVAVVAAWIESMTAERGYPPPAD